MANVDLWEVREHQKHVAPDSEIATARPAAHQLVANSADTSPSERKSPSS